MKEPDHSAQLHVHFGLSDEKLKAAEANGKPASSQMEITDIKTGCCHCVAASVHHQNDVMLMEMGLQVILRSMDHMMARLKDPELVRKELNDMMARLGEKSVERYMSGFGFMKRPNEAN